MNENKGNKVIDKQNKLVLKINKLSLRYYDEMAKLHYKLIKFDEELKLARKEDSK